MRTLFKLGLAAAAVAAPRVAFCGGAPRAFLQIREVTAFKDGHAFVLREGDAAVGADGDVVLDELPHAALGTFWPFCGDARAALASVVAGRRPAAVEHTALGVPDLLRANVGADATFLETGGARWSGKIVGFPQRSLAELRDAAPAAAQPERGDVMLVETVEGTKAVSVARIEGVTFKGNCATAVTSDELRGRLTMKLAWKGAPAATARVGYVCLENGFRWIPSYRIDVDGAGHAKVRLEATLVDDLADLDHAAVHLVVGVPKFDFAATLDPISLGADAAEVVSRMPRASNFALSFSNAIQTQIASNVEFGPAQAADAAVGALADPVGGASRTEDLFVFDLKDVTLARGERMTVQVAEFDAPYSDVYAVDVPFAPPAEIWRSSGRSPEELQRAREMSRPVAQHVIRIEDKSPFPITTAPALVLRDGRALGQGRTSYTPPGGRCDVGVTTAVGLRVKKDERETKRTPDAMRWHGDAFTRVDVAGTLSLRNDTDRACEIEVTRRVLGTVDASDHDAVVVAPNVAEDTEIASDADRPAWWPWFNWPWWWTSVNGAARITWTTKLEPHAGVDLTYAWHYFWE